MIRINKFTLLLIVLGAVFFSLPLKAQVNVGSQNNPQPFSLLELTTTTQKGGLRLPQLTTAKRDSITPTLVSNSETSKGLLIYNTTTDCIEFWDGAEWVELCNDKANIVFTNPGGNPSNPADLIDPTRSHFPGIGGTKGPFVPHDNPECTTENPTYSVDIIAGGDYTALTIIDPTTGQFMISMKENPDNVVYTYDPRTAIVRITDNCTKVYQDFIFVQDASISCITPTQPSEITGPATVSANATGLIYSVVRDSLIYPSVIQYNWNLPMGWMKTDGGRTNSITVTAGTAGGTITVTPLTVTCIGTPRTMNVNVAAACTPPAQPSVITGDTTVCASVTGPTNNFTYSVTNVSDVTYTWEVPTGWNITGGQGTNSITVTANPTALSGNISVTPSNSCGTGTNRTFAVTFIPQPLQTPTITGPATVCSGSTQTYSVNSIPNATSYIWTVTEVNGWEITAGQGTDTITVTAGTVNGRISVSPRNDCGTPGTGGTYAVTVTTTPAQPSAITGDTTACSGTAHTYSVTNVAGVTYNWTVPTDWTITRGQGTNSITVTTSIVSGTIAVTPSNGTCSGTARTLYVTITQTPPQPSEITGPSSVDPNTAGLIYSVTNVPGVTYQWSTPANDWQITSGQGTNSVTVRSGTAQSLVYVTPINNGCAGTQRTKYIYLQGGIGVLSGRTCFDIGYSNSGDSCGNPIGRTWIANFNKDSINTQIYTFNVRPSTGSFTPNVSKVRFSYEESLPGKIVESLTSVNQYYETALGISSAVRATLVYKSSLDTTARGLTYKYPLTVDIKATYNDKGDGTGKDTTVIITARIQDCSCCGAKISTTEEYKPFMCHNLGADYSADPTVPAQALHGAMYKWGTGQVALVAADNIATSGAINSWDSIGGIPPSTGDWNMTTANPCPSGYHVPTNAEWQSVVNNNTSTKIGNSGFWSSGTNIWNNALQIGDNNLLLPAAGLRLVQGNGGVPNYAAISQRGNGIYYWSSNGYDNTYANALVFGGNYTYTVPTLDHTTFSSWKVNGLSVRCIAD